MRIEKIEANKIKITLYSEDLQMFNLTKSKIKNDTPELHIFLCEIMKRVQSETNFDPYDGQVLVEAMPFEQGLVLMISKAEKPCTKKIRHVKAIKKEPKEVCSICAFDSFRDLSRMFEECGNVINADSELCKIDEAFYLILKNVPDKKISEYARVVRGNAVAAAHIRERGVHIASGDELFEMAEFMADCER